MSEPFNNRIKFNKPNVQKNFILKVENVLNLSEGQLAKKLKICRRTLRDWTKENLTISKIAAEKMSKWSGVSIPKNHKIIEWKLHWQKAGRMGARAKLAKYGSVCNDEEYRKEKWKEWWKKAGRYRKPPTGFQTIIKIRKPKKSKLLAEFIGILLGDGSITPYHIGITLCSEEKLYIKYVCATIEKLFGVEPKIFKHKTSRAVTIVVNRKLIVDFCQKFGFEMGNKVLHQVDIPNWIKENKIFSRECVRGLFDTDGCFFIHTYKVGNKKYSYLKMAFTSASTSLRLSVKNFLLDSGFSVRVSKVRTNSNGRDVRIDDTQFVQKYIREIGSHNQKHLDRIKKFAETVGLEPTDGFRPSRLSKPLV